MALSAGEAISMATQACTDGARFRVAYRGQMRGLRLIARAEFYQRDMIGTALQIRRQHVGGAPGWLT